MKQMTGIQKEAAMPKASDTTACTGVMRAPPSMAIMRPEAASLALSPVTPSRAMP